MARASDKLFAAQVAPFGAAGALVLAQNNRFKRNQGGPPFGGTLTSGRLADSWLKAR